jgi:hypothetical protein
MTKAYNHGIVALISLNKQAKVRFLSGFSSDGCREAVIEGNG